MVRAHDWWIQLITGRRILWGLEFDPEGVGVDSGSELQYGVGSDYRGNADRLGSCQVIREAIRLFPHLLFPSSPHGDKAAFASRNSRLGLFRATPIGLGFGNAVISFLDQQKRLQHRDI